MTATGRLACAALVLLATACVTTPGGERGAATPASEEIADIRPGERPPLASDEAGLWMMMDRAEQGLKTSGNLVRDRALNDYVRSIVCRLAGSYCADIRIYIVRMPYFNASMAPNGVMQVWTGLILRARSEAQLATVLGHELAHYLRRHSLKAFRELRSTAGLLVFFQIAAAGAGVPTAGQIATLIATGSIFAYSRDNEREADRVGLDLMHAAGYDPRAASGIWKRLIREEEADEDKKAPSLFFATHPAPEERMQTLDRLAAARIGGGPAGELGTARLRGIVLPRRLSYLGDEMHLRRFSRAQELLKMLLEDGANLGELHYFRGELHRLRADVEEKDYETALDAYREALAAGGVPPEVHRSMGLLLMKTGRYEEARASYRKYLRLKPAANDRMIIEMLVRQMG